MSELPDRFLVIESELARIWLIQRRDEGSWLQHIWGRYGWHNHDVIDDQEAMMLYQSDCVFVEKVK